jgi:hypothetical protein
VFGAEFALADLLSPRMTHIEEGTMKKTAPPFGSDFEWGAVPRKRTGYRNTLDLRIWERIVVRVAAILLFLAHLVFASYILFTS